MSSRFTRGKQAIQVTEGTLVARVALDKNYRDAFEEAAEKLLESDARELVIDLSQIDFVSSSCFGIILSLQVKGTNRGKYIALKVNPDLVGVLDLLGIRAMIPTTVVHTGQKPRDFDLQGNRLVINRDLEPGDHTALQVWIRRLADLVGTPVVDLKVVRNIDSRCIGLLTELWVTCVQRNQPPVYEVSPEVFERLRQLNLDRVFTIRVS